MRIIGLLCLCACQPRAPGAFCDAPPPPLLEIGTGETVFESLDTPAEVQAHERLQGGIHIWGSLRATGIWPGVPGDLSDPNNPVVDFLIIDPSGAPVGGYDGLARAFVEGRDGPHELVGDVLVVDMDMEPEGSPATLDVRVTDACGLVLTAQSDVVIFDPWE